MEVTHQDSNLRAGDDQNNENQKQESKDIVDTAEPNAVHNEIQLNEDGTEGENTAD